MNKKDSIRTYLLDQRDGQHFTADGLAFAVNQKGDTDSKITAKDVSNVTRELLKVAAISRIREKNGEYVYTVLANIMTVYFSKNPIAGTDRKTQRPKSDAAFIAEHKPARRKIRPPMIRAFDEQIETYKRQIKQVEGWKRDWLAGNAS